MGRSNSPLLVNFAAPEAASVIVGSADRAVVPARATSSIQKKHLLPYVSIATFIFPSISSFSVPFKTSIRTSSVFQIPRIIACGDPFCFLQYCRLLDFTFLNEPVIWIEVTSIYIRGFDLPLFQFTVFDHHVDIKLDVAFFIDEEMGHPGISAEVLYVFG